jgi:hypothetical protein
MPTQAPNPAHALDAAMSIVRRWASHAMRTKSKFVVGGLVTLLLFWLVIALTRPSTSSVNVGSAVKTEDLPAIRRAISSKNWRSFGLAVRSVDFKAMADSLGRLFHTRILSVAGHSGPPGGVLVQGRVGPTTACVYMVFQTTNGWTCDQANTLHLK